MFRPRNYLFILFTVCSIIKSEIIYNSLYLMEFENVNKDFTIDHLQKAFPDLIKENYAFRTDINVEYAGDIEPYLKDPLEDNSSSALIVNGRYFSSGKQVDVELEVYDIYTWELLQNKTFSVIQMM